LVTEAGDMPRARQLLIFCEVLTGSRRDVNKLKHQSNS
jgi:hypothetical protein